MQKQRPIIDASALAGVDRTYCARCGTTQQPIAAHHIVHRSHIRLDISANLVALCVRCHDTVHKDRLAALALLEGRSAEQLEQLKAAAPQWNGWYK